MPPTRPPVCDDKIRKTWSNISIVSYSSTEQDRYLRVQPTTKYELRHNSKMNIQNIFKKNKTEKSIDAIEGVEVFGSNLANFLYVGLVTLLG